MYLFCYCLSVMMLTRVVIKNVTFKGAGRKIRHAIDQLTFAPVYANFLLNNIPSKALSKKKLTFGAAKSPKRKIEDCVILVESFGKII